jgi:hypothetical protein
MRSTTIAGQAPRTMPISRRWPPLEMWPLLLLGSVLLGSAWVLATSAIGSGDYGQWLMTARPYLGESVPDYRAASAVPPVIPFLLSLVVRLSGDPAQGIHLFAVLLLAALGMSAYAAASSLFGTRLAGLLAVIGALLLTDRFLELFAFGGMLQAGAILFLWLGVAALFRAGTRPAREMAWWTAGGVAIGIAAVTHVGTASIAVPTGIAVGLLSAMHATPSWRSRLRRLVPLAASLAAAGIYSVAILLPGGTELAQNPASLAYRGPGRLLEGLAEYWPALVMAAVAIVGLAGGLAEELRRRSIGPWTVIAAWAFITVAVVLAAVVTGAATDYPRFATPLLAPVVIAAGGAGAAALRLAGGWLAAAAQRGAAAAWSLGLAALLVTVTAWPAMATFGTQTNGYQMADPASLQQAVSWMEANVAPGSTVLAPVREGKWVEGLSGRAALFSSAVRYSFRPDEWRRSLAADTLLRSGGAVVNSFFFIRLTDDVADAAVPRGMAIGVNHGGEYLDLLRIAPAETRIMDGAGATVATLPNMAGATRTVTSDTVAASVISTWTTERQKAPASFKETVSLKSDASTLEIRATAATTAPAAFELVLRPADQPVAGLSLAGSEAEMSFAVAGSGEPGLRVLLDGAGTTLEGLADGGLRVRSSGGPVHLLITDLTGAGSPITGTGFLDPSSLVAAYDIGAVLLVRDDAFESRRIRLVALGFHLRQIFGPYGVMTK